MRADPTNHNSSVPHGRSFCQNVHASLRNCVHVGYGGPDHWAPGSRGVHHPYDLVSSFVILAPAVWFYGHPGST